MNVTIFGAGYVGLVQAAVLAEVGNKVTCVDISSERVGNLKKGIIPIYEPGLSEIILSCLDNGTLTFTTDAKSAVESSSVIFIAVGTPPGEDGSADLKYVLAVSETIGTYANNQKIVITKSTVPVGTGDKVEKAIKDASKKANPGDELLDLINDKYIVVSNPEFLKEGAAIHDCKFPDRIIVGTNNNLAKSVMKELYSPFMRNHDKLIFMDRRSAELTKYAANCMLATKISFMNEMSNIAEQVGADIELVRIGIGSDPRIGYSFIYPGCGYGGSCFPKDVKALIQTSQDIGYDAQILKSVESINQLQKCKIPSYIHKHYKVSDTRDALKGKKFALWGLSFKPNTDDMREAPSLVVLDYLLSSGAEVFAYDPEAMEETRRLFENESFFDNLHFKTNPFECIEEADALVINTEWECFRSPDFNILKDKLNDSVIFDGRNLYDPDKLSSIGVSYYAIGRGLSVNSY